MTYTPIKPDSGPSPKVDADFIRANFAQFEDIFSLNTGGIIYNHTGLNDRNQGDHEAVLMQKQTVDPEVTQNLCVLYPKDTASNIDTQPQLYVRIKQFLPNQEDPKDVLNNPMQLTYNKVNTSGPVYQSFMAGGYLIYFGITSDITMNITVSPAPKALLIAIASAYNVASANIAFDVSTRIINTTTFKINSNAATGVYNFGWIAIGTA